MLKKVFIFIWIFLIGFIFSYPVNAAAEPIKIVENPDFKETCQNQWLKQFTFNESTGTLVIQTPVSDTGLQLTEVEIDKIGGTDITPNILCKPLQVGVIGSPLSLSCSLNPQLNPLALNILKSSKSQSLNQSLNWEFTKQIGGTLALGQDKVNCPEDNQSVPIAYAGTTKPTDVKAQVAPQAQPPVPPPQACQTKVKICSDGSLPESDGRCRKGRGGKGSEPTVEVPGCSDPNMESYTDTNGACFCKPKAGAVKKCGDPGAPECSKAGGESCDPKNGALGGTGGILTAIGCVPTEPKALVEGILRVTAVGIGAIALLLMVLGAFKMITSDGNPDSIQGGKDQFTAAFLGLLFIIFSVLLLQVIGVDILNIPGFKP